ncbi:hypothetical protein BH18THE2_BH18THE2_15760 [soil metagenome]
MDRSIIGQPLPLRKEQENQVLYLVFYFIQAYLAILRTNFAMPNINFRIIESDDISPRIF